MATAHCHTNGVLNSSSGGELKLYLKGKRNTLLQFSGPVQDSQADTVSILTDPPSPVLLIHHIVHEICFIFVKSDGGALTCNIDNIDSNNAAQFRFVIRRKFFFYSKISFKKPWPLMWGSIVLAAQRRFYCIGHSKEVLLYWPLKGGSTVLTAQRKSYCIGHSKGVLLYWPPKRGSTVQAAHVRFYSIGHSKEVLLYWPLMWGSTVLTAHVRFYCIGRSCEVLLYWSLKGGSIVLVVQRRFYCIGCSCEVLLYWLLKGGSTLLDTHVRFYCVGHS